MSTLHEYELILKEVISYTYLEQLVSVNLPEATVVRQDGETKLAFTVPKGIYPPTHQRDTILAVNRLGYLVKDIRSL